VGDLSDDIWLYRAITKKAWFDVNTQQIQPAAFRLRSREHTESGYEIGISTDLEPNLSYQNIDDAGRYRLRLSPCFGILKILVGQVRKLGLVVDNNHHSHVNILGFPHPDLQKEQYFKVLDHLSQVAIIHCLFNPPKQKPK
jgi:hypothetical protein